MKEWPPQQGLLTPVLKVKGMPYTTGQGGTQGCSWPPWNALSLKGLHHSEWTGGVLLA